MNTNTYPTTVSHLQLLHIPFKIIIVIITRQLIHFINLYLYFIRNHIHIRIRICICICMYIRRSHPPPCIRIRICIDIILVFIFVVPLCENQDNNSHT